MASRDITSRNARFATQPDVVMPRTRFPLPMRVRTAFDAGYLVPLGWQEVLPGDTAQCSYGFFGRMATPIHPLLDDAYVSVHSWFIPDRLVWANAPKFYGERTSPSDNTDYLKPQVNAPSGGWTKNSIGDYFGLPIGYEGPVNALPFRAYNLVFNEFYRANHIVEQVPQANDDGPDPENYYTLLRRMKRADYFTSCNPFAQKGDPVLLPIGGQAPIEMESGQQNIGFFGAATAFTVAVSGGTLQSTPTTNTGNMKLDPDGSHMIANLANAQTITVNEFREAVALQRMQERDARYGTRYAEIIRGGWGVTTDDARLNRPEWLAGVTQRIGISSIPQTSGTPAAGDETPQGNLAAMGTMANQGGGFSRSFTEHGLILHLAVVRGTNGYTQGLHKKWTRQNRLEHYHPEMAHLGEQEVLSKELFADGSADDDNVFGYQERWAEYKYGESILTGVMRQDLEAWHLAQRFTARPTLSPSFMEENPPVDRVIAVQTEPQFLFDIIFDQNWARIMPPYANPGLKRI